MSVTDPLLKKLKAYILEFRTKDVEKPVDDRHRSLQTFCDTLECILRKGIKHTNSLFGLNKRDYWHWIGPLSKNNNGRRIPPVLSLVIDGVHKCRKLIERAVARCIMCTAGTSVMGLLRVAAHKAYLSCLQTATAQGRGRLFIRLALQRKVFHRCVEHLMSDVEYLEQWYDPACSIIGNEILCEILMSLLYQLNEVNFSLDVKNAAFLDDTWLLPMHFDHQLVPCFNIGIRVQYIHGRPFVIHVEKGSVAEDDGLIEVGDVLDELLNIETRSLKIGQVCHLLKQNRGAPIQLGVVKCKLPDHSLFPPIMELLRKGGRDYDSLQKVLDDDEERVKNQSNGIPPPHAVLPEDELEQVPVHSGQDKAIYKLKYIGKIDTGEFGGVGQVEHVIVKAIDEHKPEENMEVLQDVVLELGETQVIVTDAQSNEELMRQSYTEISSCGRRVDRVLYFCFIVGDTTCTLSKEFAAHVFRASYDEECKTILCAIAQGFDRTHWFV